MKAILVIDVPLEDSIDFGHLDIRANVKVDAYDDLKHTFKPIEYKFVKVEPMPQYMTMKNVVSCDYNEAFVNGFNTCIDEILGE